MKLRYGIEYQNIENAKVVSIQIKIIMKRILLIIFKSLKQYTENDIEDVSFHFETLVLKNKFECNSISYIKKFENHYLNFIAKFIFLKIPQKNSSNKSPTKCFII